MGMIRNARLDDLDTLRDIERAAGRLFAEIGMAEVADDEPLSEETLRGYQSCGRAWVAVDDSDRPIGYLVADILDGNAHIEQLSVLPANMRKGLGRALIEQLAAWASGLGMEAVTLTTFVDVPWNGPYYRRLGFEMLTEEEIKPELRDRRNHETGRGLDRWPRICMRRALPG
jgi:GNAT superfamily N-acetyltransferase